jgi:predicted outer membrane protein
MGKSALIRFVMVSMAATACASGGAGTGMSTGMGTGATGSTASATTTTISGGDVSLSNSGLWSDGTSGGIWMDTTGAIRMGGRRGQLIGLEAANIRTMTEPNMIAHVTAGDSLEVALSELAMTRTQNTSVQDFLQRMITQHTTHMQMSRHLASAHGVTPATAPGDTVDAMMASRMMQRLTRESPGLAASNMNTGSPTAAANLDRQVMGAEVAMHRRMLRELQMMQPQATGAARQLVDQTIPVVRQHLADAEALWRQLGGGTTESR